MRSIRYNILFAVGLMLTLGISAMMANTVDKKKRPKGMGSLVVTTREESYPVKVDGQYIGMSGIDNGAEFYLDPGIHTIEVTKSGLADPPASAPRKRGFSNTAAIFLP